MFAVRHDGNYELGLLVTARVLIDILEVVMSNLIVETVIISLSSTVGKITCQITLPINFKEANCNSSSKVIDH